MLEQLYETWPSTVHAVTEKRGHIYGWIYRAQFHGSAYRKHRGHGPNFIKLLSRNYCMTNFLARQKLIVGHQSQQCELKVI